MAGIDANLRAAVAAMTHVRAMVGIDANLRTAVAAMTHVRAMAGIDANLRTAVAAMTPVNPMVGVNHDLMAAIAAFKVSVRIGDSAIAATNLARMSEAVAMPAITPSEGHAERIRDLERERNALRKSLAALTSRIRRLERQMFRLPLFYVTDFEDTEFSEN